MKESFQSPDPSKSSTREESLELSRLNTYEFRDDATGEKFHYLIVTGKSFFDRNKEKFVSMLLKGIINTADVVEDSAGRLFSHEQKVENLTSNKENFFESLEADALIFSSIVCDEDRSYEKAKGLSKIKNSISNDKWQDKNHNIAINTKEDKVYHFDFGHALVYKYSVLQQRKEKEFQRFVEESINTSMKKIKNSNAYLQILDEKIHKLYNQCFLDDSHSFFNAVAKRSEMVKSKTLTQLEMTKDLLDEEKIAFLFNEMKKRTEIVRDILQKKLNVSA